MGAELEIIKQRLPIAKKKTGEEVLTCDAEGEPLIGAIHVAFFF